MQYPLPAWCCSKRTAAALLGVSFSQFSHRSSCPSLCFVYLSVLDALSFLHRLNREGTLRTIRKGIDSILNGPVTAGQLYSRRSIVDSHSLPAPPHAAPAW